MRQQAVSTRGRHVRGRDDVHDIKVRVSSIEENMGAMNRRIDRVKDRRERIERRLDLVETA